MIRNYFITAYRNLWRNKMVSAISIVGLSIGIAVGLLSYLHIRYELSFDGFHDKKDRIYRIVTGDVKSGQGWVGISAPIPPKLKSDIPEIEDFVRLTKLDRDGKVVVHHDNQSFNEANFFLADASLFSIFDFSFIHGQPEQAFQTPDGIVVTASRAEKLFGASSPLGKIVKINDKHEFRVSGVIEDLRPNSHLALDMIVSFENLETLLPYASLDGNWGQYNYYGYALLRQGADLAAAERKIKAIEVPLKDYTHTFEQLGLQPMTDIHFEHNRGNMKASYDRKYLYIYGASALGLIFISLVNFINLKTAGSSKRIREVGVRKAIGARRGELVVQFVAEAFLLCLVSLALGLFIMNTWLLPYVNNLLGADLQFHLFDLPNASLGLLGLLVISLLSGTYIAQFITSFSPMEALKSQIKTSSGRGLKFRDVLLGVQFFVSLILIIGSLIITRQMQHVSDINLGLNPDQVLNIPLYVEVEKEKRSVLKNELNSLPNVTHVSLNSFNPGQANWNQTTWWEGQEEDESMFIISVDPDFFETADVKLIEGSLDHIKSNLSERYTYVLNQSARQHIGWEQAVGRQVSPFGDDARKPVTGVIEDFTFQSLHDRVKPCLLVVGDLTPSQLYVKVRAQDVQATVAAVEDKLASILPALPFEYAFLDDLFGQLYLAETQAREISLFYTIVCILLALFGLYGILTFEVTERAKEIAIRKVIGAKVLHIVGLLSRDFLRLILIALVLASPIAYFMMDGWLQDFAYRIDIPWWIFVVAGLVAALIALAIVALQGVRAALLNPVHALRGE